MDNNKPTLKGYGKELGASGTYIFSGIITQEEYNAAITGQNARKIFDIMRRSDATVHAALQACKLPIRSIEYTIEQATEDAADVAIANFVENELFNRKINFADYLREALTMFDFGFSVFEKVYEMYELEGSMRIGIAKLASRKQRSVLYWQTQDGKPGIQQQLLGGQTPGGSGIISIPMEKLIVFTNDKEGDNYEGMSLLRFCFKDWDMKDKLGLVNAIALEKLAVGVPVLMPPADADPTEVAAAEASLRQMRANEEAFMRIPSGWAIEMLDMKASSTKDVLPTIDYHNHQIMMSVLAQFLLLGGSKSGGGSRAVSKDHSQLFMLSEEAAVKNFVNATQKQLITQLCDLNFSDLPNGYPKLKSSRVADEDMAIMASAMNSYATAGLLTPDAELEQFVRQTIHAPDMTEEQIASYDTDHAAAVAKLPTEQLGGTTVAKETNTKPTTKASALSNAHNAKRALIDILVRE